MRQYEVHFVDQSVEVLEAEDIAEAREKAERLLDIPVAKVVALPDPVDDETDEEEEDEEAESEDGD